MRTFISVPVPENEQINLLLSNLKKFKEVKPVTSKNLHVCLRFLGETTDADIEKIKEKMESLHGTGQFSFKLHGYGAFPDMDFMRVLWIGVEDGEGKQKLQELYELLEPKLVEIGFQKESREFTPHLTVGRVRRKPSDVLRGTKDLYKDQDFGEVSVKQVHLMKSELKPSGAKYKILHSVEL
jgi:2'-5' RNA ligase